MRILVVEDEKKIATYVQRGLKESGFAVDVVHRGDDALEIIADQHFDAVVLDIMLPGRDGLSILRILRERANSVPVVILSARGEISDKIEGLNLGADDYLAKPFSIEELAARMRALVRRNSGEAVISLLECLMRSPGRVCTRTQLCQHVWEYHFDTETNLVDVYIQRLRRKVDDGETTKLIQTMRGVGYRIGDLT
jgi:two-component system, OmpR family, response regulator